MNDPPEPEPFVPLAVVASQRIYASPWCGLRRDELVLPDGALQEYHVFEVPDAVVVVPTLADGRVLLVWQYRHPLATTHFEVPAGRIGEGESPAEAAAREVLEETGHRAGALEPLGGFYPMNGISNHFAHAFAARDCEPVGAPTLEPAELLRVQALPREQVLDMLRAGRFEDGFSALALFYWSTPR